MFLTYEVVHTHKKKIFESFEIKHCKELLVLQKQHKIQSVPSPLSPKQKNEGHPSPLNTDHTRWLYFRKNHPFPLINLPVYDIFLKCWPPPAITPSPTISCGRVLQDTLGPFKLKSIWYLCVICVFSYVFLVKIRKCRNMIVNKVLLILSRYVSVEIWSWTKCF